MLLATRIPDLTEQLRAATLRAMAEQRRTGTGPHISDLAQLKQRLMQCLEQLGYAVTLRRAA